MSSALYGLTVFAGALKNEKRPGLVMVQLASLLISCRGGAGLLAWIVILLILSGAALSPMRGTPTNNFRMGLPPGYRMAMPLAVCWRKSIMMDFENSDIF